MSKTELLKKDKQIKCLLMKNSSHKLRETQIGNQKKFQN